MVDACREMVISRYRFRETAGESFRNLYFIDAELQDEMQSPQRVQFIPGFLAAISAAFNASYLQPRVQAIQSVQLLLSIYILKGFINLTMFTMVPMGQYAVQCTILPSLLDINRIIPNPTIPKPPAIRVAVRTGALINLRVTAAAITREITVHFSAHLLPIGPRRVFLPEETESSAPK